MFRPLVLPILWLLLLPDMAEAQSAADPAILTAYYSDRPPFSMVEGQTGILLGLTKTILTEAGIRARFIELPAARILEMLRFGQTEALGVGMYQEKGKDPPGRYSLPFYQESPAVVVMNSRMASSTGSSFRLEALLAAPFTLGLKSGTSLGPVLDQKIRAQGLTPLETGASIPEMLRLIQGGRMDYTLLSAEEAQYLMKKDSSLSSGLVLARLTDAPPGNLRYFLYPEGFDPSLAEKIDAAIERLKTTVRSPAPARTLAGEPAPRADVRLP